MSDELCHCGLLIEDHRLGGDAEHNFIPRSEMPDETVIPSEVTEEVKVPRLFMRNLNSFEPWACIADLPLDDTGKRTVSDFVLGEIDGMTFFGETQQTIEFKIQMMTESEVNALPEM